jgi:hypothetical protein
VFASLNYNFADDANALNSPLEIKFNLDVTDSADPANWGTIAVGAFQNLFVNDNRNKFSSLFRDNGATQQFQGNGTTEPITGTEIGSTMTFTDGDEITLLLSDTAGTGSAFNGNGSVARIYVNDVLQFTSPTSASPRATATSRSRQMAPRPTTTTSPSPPPPPSPPIPSRTG